jgi:hypothetical protein
MRALVLGLATLALSAGAASAQVGYPGYDYNGATVPLYGYAAPGYGYAATAPLYNYAAPAYGYGAPATAGTTVIIVTPGAGYTAPPVVSGQPIYNYAPGYDYTPGYWNRGYWGRWHAGWWR